jgi:hypothetical protein
VALKEAELKRWQRDAKQSGALPEGVKYFGASDGGGLTFTLSLSGSASWVFRYRHAGRPREMTLGNYPDMSLEKAREAALKLNTVGPQRKAWR